MRCWQIIVVDDQPEGSLEAVFRVPFYFYRADQEEDPSKGKREDSLNKILTPHLPDSYAMENEEEFQIYSLSDRRKSCYEKMGRLPIVDCVRTFVEAWELFDEYSTENYPPDMVFLDVKLDKGGDAEKDILKIQNQIRSRLHDDEERLVSGTQELKEHGGLYLFGKLLRLFPSRENMPLVTVYSESERVQDDYAPIEYAYEGSFSVRGKKKLKDDASIRRQLVEARLLQYIQTGVINVSAVEESLEDLGQYLDIMDRHIQERQAGGTIIPPRQTGDLLASAMSKDIGAGWCFGTFFIYQTPRIADRSLETPQETRRQCYQEIQLYLRRVDNCQVLYYIFEQTPLKLYSHPAETVKFSGGNPSWLPDEFQHQKDMSLRELVEYAQRLKAESGDRIDRVLPSLLNQIEQCGTDLKVLVHHLPERPQDLQNLIVNNEDTDNVLKTIETLRTGCRVRSVPKAIYKWLCDVCDGQVDLKRKNDGNEYIERPVPITGNQTFERTDGALLTTLTYTLPDGRPVADLIGAIVSSVVTKAYPEASRDTDRPLWWAMRLDRGNNRLIVELEDKGVGFQELDYFNFLMEKGGLSTAIQKSKGWLILEIHSGGKKRNPFVNDSRQIGPSDFQGGCKYVMSIFVHIEEENI